MKTKFAAALLAGLMLSTPAWAMDLAAARASGAIGEKTDGYVVALQNTPEVSALVTEVNAKRQVEYTTIAKESGQPLAVVGKLAAPQILKGLPAGAMYQGADGSWKKR